MQILLPVSTFFPDKHYIKATIVPSDNIEASVEIMFDDKELFEKVAMAEEPEADIDADAEDIDDLLEDEIDDAYEDKKLIKDLKSSLKVADDESGDTENDV